MIMQALLGTGSCPVLCVALLRHKSGWGMQLAIMAPQVGMAMQVLLCGAGSELGFLASARVLARLNAVSCRLFPLPPALARGQGSRGGSPGEQPPADLRGPAVAGASCALVGAKGRDFGESAMSAMAFEPVNNGIAGVSCEDMWAGAGHSEGPLSVDMGDLGGPAGCDTPGAASGAAAAAAPAVGMGKVLSGRLLMRLCWSGAAGMEVDTSECASRLDVGAQPVLC